MAGVDRDSIAERLHQVLAEFAETDARIRESALSRARLLARDLSRPVEFLVIGPHRAAIDMMRFLAGLDEEIPEDLSALVACIRIAHGAAPKLMARNGDNHLIAIPSEPIMLAPHAPVTLTYRRPAPILQTFQLSHLRSLSPATDDPTLLARLGRADGLIWLSDAADPWSRAEDDLYLSLPARLIDNAVLVLTDAARVIASAELHAGFDAKVHLLRDRFGALLPLSLQAALQSAPGGFLADAEMFDASGAHALLISIRDLQMQTRRLKDEEAERSLRNLRKAVDTARAAQKQKALAETRPAKTPDVALVETGAGTATRLAASTAPPGPERAPTDPPVQVGDAPNYRHPDEAALAILREEAAFEAQARRRDATARRGPDTTPPAPAEVPTPTNPEADDDSLAGFLRRCRAAHQAREFDRSDPVQRREAFDAMLDLLAGLARRLRDAREDIHDRERLLDEIEEGEDLLMLLSCEADDAALTEAADVVTQLLGDLFDRQ